jgi:hypothetical protein
LEILVKILNPVFEIEGVSKTYSTIFPFSHTFLYGLDGNADMVGKKVQENKSKLRFSLEFNQTSKYEEKDSHPPFSIYLCSEHNCFICYTFAFPGNFSCLQELLLKENTGT